MDGWMEDRLIKKLQFCAGAADWIENFRRRIATLYSGGVWRVPHKPPVPPRGFTMSLDVILLREQLHVVPRTFVHN